MGKFINGTIGILAAVLIIVGLSGCNGTNADLQTSVAVDPEPTIEELSNGLLVAFTDSKFEEIKGKEPVALFFHADWCVTCRSIEDGLIASASTFPDGAKILRVNFDTEVELRREYKVVMQSMLVFLDSDGNVAKKLAAPSIEQIKDAFKEVL